MKKLAFLGGAVALGALALTQAPLTSHAADHVDAPTIAMTANRMADINDVYAWMTTDSAKVNLALTVSPFDDGTKSFGPTVVYAFHLSSRPGFAMAGKESKVICKFASNTSGECFVVDPDGKTIDYVKGDFSAVSGKSAPSGKFKVFAGHRSDPFFFNLGGFALARRNAELACNNSTTMPGACPGVLPVDAAGCPTVAAINTATAAGLRALVSTAPTTANPANTPCPANQIDCFAGFNVMAIVVEVDKTLLLNGSDKLVSVWASTHVGS